MKNLEARINILEAKINPPLDLIVVLVRKDDVSCEAAKARVLAEHGIDKVPDGCCTVVLNIYSKPEML